MEVEASLTCTYLSCGPSPHCIPSPLIIILIIIHFLFLASSWSKVLAAAT